MEFDPHTVIGGIHHRESVAAEKVHVAKGPWNAAVGHDNGHLMKGLRQEAPKIPIVVRASESGPRVALDGMVQIRKSQGIAEEEHRSVVAHDVPVALLGVELDGGPANVSFSIGGATLAGDSREAYEHRRLLADLAEYLRPCIARNVAGDREGPVRPPAFGMHAAFRNDFAVEVRQLLKQPDVLEQCRAPRASGLNVGVVGERVSVALVNLASVEMMSSEVLDRRSWFCALNTSSGPTPWRRGSGTACSHPCHADPRITLQKLRRLKLGSLSASTSAVTVPNVVSGLCPKPS